MHAHRITRDHSPRSSPATIRAFRPTYALRRKVASMGCAASSGRIVCTMDITPRAVALPKSTDDLPKGKYGPIFPRTPACYGFTIIANVKPGRADAIREHGRRLAEAIESDPHILAPLKLHYLRWVLFDDDTRFMYQGIFDTDFDKYTEDAVLLFGKAGID